MTCPCPSWMAFGYLNAITARSPFKEIFPNRPSFTWKPMMASHLPSLGYPPNWQLQPCWQLQASMLSAFTRKGVLPSFAFAGVFFFTFVFPGIYHLRLKEIVSDHIHPFCSSSNNTFELKGNIAVFLFRVCVALVFESAQSCNQA